MIELKHIYKSYHRQSVETKVLKDINFVIEKGTFTAIMGTSGCGKSTLLNILGCMDSFDSGEYLFEGTDIHNKSQRELAIFRNQKLGFIFQAFHLIDDMTAEENIQVPLGYAGISSKKRKEISDRLLERVGLKEKAKNKPSQLSGGQQQRIAIARALANHPTVLLADEPTGNLDYESGLEIMSLLKELNRYGMTIVMVTHDLNLASYADTHINMIDGKLLEK